MQKNISDSLQDNMEYLDKMLHRDKSFDILNHRITFGDKEAAYYFIDGFCKDEIMQKMNEFFLKWKDENQCKSVEECIYIDARTYPARDVSQPDKEKAL